MLVPLEDAPEDAVVDLAAELASELAAELANNLPELPVQCRHQSQCVWTPRVRGLRLT